MHYLTAVSVNCHVVPVLRTNTVQLGSMPTLDFSRPTFHVRFDDVGKSDEQVTNWHVQIVRFFLLLRLRRTVLVQ